MDVACETEGNGFALQACDRCRANKKKCDRVFPGCTTCKKKLLKCSYEENRTQLEIRRLRSQVKHLVNRSTHKPSNVFSPNQMALGPMMPYPIPSRWYMPYLVNHYHELQFPSFSRNEGSSSDIDPLSKNQWMQAPLSDPCMFHGILFAASSHLDILRGEDDNPITEYHRRHAIRLLRHHISSSANVSITAVATAMYLWHYEVMNSNTTEGRIHKLGLQQMVERNGGIEILGLSSNHLSNLIVLIDIGDSILNADKPVFSTKNSCHHCEAPISFVSTILRQSDRKLHESGIDKPLVSLLRRVHKATLDFEFELSNEPVEDSTMDERPETESSFSKAIRLAATIHLNSLQHRIRFSAIENQVFVEKLRLELASLPQGSDLDVRNEIYIFLCFTGAASARENRPWFLAKAGPVVMSLNHSQLHHFKMVVTRFCAILQKLEDIQARTEGES